MPRAKKTDLVQPPRPAPPGPPDPTPELLDRYLRIEDRRLKAQTLVTELEKESKAIRADLVAFVKRRKLKKDQAITIGDFEVIRERFRKYVWWKDAYEAAFGAEAAAKLAKKQPMKDGVKVVRKAKAA
jgi:hypothetical protein